MSKPCEFWEAQYCVEGRWFRLGGRSLEDARKAIALATGDRRIECRMLGNDDLAAKYRIQHYVGTVETVETAG